MFSFQKKSHRCIPKVFGTFHFTCATVDILNRPEELNSVYFCLFKRKLLKLKYMKSVLFFTGNR